MTVPTIPSGAFLAGLRERGFDVYTGVPCSLLGPLYPHLDEDEGLLHVAAVREDEAVAHAAGAWLAGRRPVVLMQNSGLGNALNAITSLSLIYGMPFLLLVTWRGFEGRDAPEHLVMGRAMREVLDAVDLPHRVLEAARWREQLDAACSEIADRRPSALIVKEGLFS